MDNEDFNDEDIIASINVIPFIDVVLVLLIIFISFKPALEVLETNLPESNKSSIIDITNNDFYLINIKPNVVKLLINNKEKSSDFDEIIEILKSKSIKSIYISADSEIKYKDVTSKIASLKNINITNINLVTKQKWLKNPPIWWVYININSSIYQ